MHLQELSDLSGTREFSSTHLGLQHLVSNPSPTLMKLVSAKRGGTTLKPHQIIIYRIGDLQTFLNGSFKYQREYRLTP